MDRFIARQNIEHYRHLLETERDPHQIELLQGMLAEEEAKLRAAEARAAGLPEAHPESAPSQPTAAPRGARPG